MCDYNNYFEIRKDPKGPLKSCINKWFGYVNYSYLGIRFCISVCHQHCNTVNKKFDEYHKSLQEPPKDMWGLKVLRSSGEFTNGWVLYANRERIQDSDYDKELAHPTDNGDLKVYVINLQEDIIKFCQISDLI